MKRSEFVKKRELYYMVAGSYEIPLWVQREVEKEIAGAEAAGVVWEPEEEPLPERLFCDGSHASDGRAAGIAFSLHDGYHDGNSRASAILREAVRRYNAWPKLREIVKKWEKYINGDPRNRWPDESVPEILAILDGKEAPNG